MRSVSTRLTLLFVALAAAVLATFSGSLYLFVREGLDRELEKELQTQERMFRERFLEEYEEVRQGVHSTLAEEIAKYVEAAGVAAEVRRQDGDLVYAFPGGPPWAGYRGRRQVLTTAGGEPFAVFLAVPESAVTHPLAQLRLYFLVFLPALLVVTGLLGTLFVRRALSPVEQLRQQAERISRANLSERVPEPRLRGEFRDLARTFNEMLDRLDRAVQDLQNFAADAAHELRTPLATLRAQLEDAIQNEEMPEEFQGFLASLSEEVARMSRVVTDLFTLAKIDMRQYALTKERVRVRQILEEAEETWQPTADEREIEIRVEGDDPVVPGDPVALRRVFMNLVENAVKYNREGGTVTLRVEAKGGIARVTVSDTGIGIPPEHVPRLFQRFYRVDKARSRDSGGAGLGLAICKSFVQAHEGKIEVMSVPGKGTTFTVELPAEERPVPSATLA